MTTRYHQILENGAVPAFPPPWFGSGDVAGVLRFIQDRGAGAPSFDVGDAGNLPPAPDAPHGQTYPFAPMWLEFTADGVAICLFIFDAGELDGLEGRDRIHGTQVLAFQKTQKGWLLLDYFSPEIEGKMALTCHHGDGADPKRIRISKGFMGVLIAFLSALACNNVEAVEIPGPAKLNKKRIKNGKLPISSHWTLIIKGRAGKNDVAMGDGSHSSPRIHLRRGHIREYKRGLFTWVQPCVVGTNRGGIVTKDYKLEAGI